MAKNQQQFLPVAVALGAGIGTAIGVARNEIAFYLGVGIALGIMLGVIIDQRNMVEREVKKDEAKRRDDDIMPRF